MDQCFIFSLRLIRNFGNIFKCNTITNGRCYYYRGRIMFNVVTLFREMRYWYTTCYFF